MNSCQTVLHSKWHVRFIELAMHIAKWSKDPSTQVGAVIVDSERRVVSVGYNGFPRGVDDTDTRLNNKQVKLQMVKHAEENAIFNSVQRPNDCILYVTHHPCASCAGSIIQSGIKYVVVPNPDSNFAFANRWRDSIDLARSMFKEAKVGVIEL